jgi:4-amino-4-deoxy-L-arabinose transferase-like glycosyltransferase
MDIDQVPLRRLRERFRGRITSGARHFTSNLTSDRAAAGYYHAALLIPVILYSLAVLHPLLNNHFHSDEAIYSHWAEYIASGRDFMLNHQAVDKPPLLLYLMALSFNIFGISELSARLPSLMAGVVTIFAVRSFADRTLGKSYGLLAALLTGCSPYLILFGPTAFADPLLTAFLAVSLSMLAAGRPFLSGVFWGLALASKQQAAFFIPLMLALAPFFAAKTKNPSGRRWLLTWLAGAVVAFAPVIVWQLNRSYPTNFWQQSLTSYGGLTFDPGKIGFRLAGFAGLFYYFTGSHLFNTVLIILSLGVIGSDIHALAARKENQDGQLAFDAIILAFTGLYLLAHSILTMQVWDRYLLPLLPLWAVWSARALSVPLEWVKARWPLRFDRYEGQRALYLLLIFMLAAMLLMPSVADASASRFPIGGDHGAYHGLPAMITTMRSVLPADATIFHHWLGWHYRFYFFNDPYTLIYWTDEQVLLQRAQEIGDHAYIVFPSWRSATEPRALLASHGLIFEEMYRTMRSDGSPAFILYHIRNSNR